jgi:riboflavin kinase/FMN adenylyltransferase
VLFRSGETSFDEGQLGHQVLFGWVRHINKRHDMARDSAERAIARARGADCENDRGQPVAARVGETAAMRVRSPAMSAMRAMEVLRGASAPPRWEAAAVAIGNFDGVHLGHRELLDRAVARARALGGPAIAVTFDPHPTSVLAPHLAPPLITTMERRLQLFAAAGVDLAVVLPFTAELAAMPAAEFVEVILRRQLAARHVVVGYDFSYGQGRGGSTSTLEAHGARAGFGVEVVPAVQVPLEAAAPKESGASGLEIASSTRIRGHLRSGNLARARRLLGHAYDVDGVVVHGAKRGRQLGFPTANVQPELDVLAGTGIYAVRFALYPEGAVAQPPEGLGAALASGPRPGAPLPAVASLGTNPTFVAGGARTLEVYVLDFAGDLYDRRVRVELVEKLRDEAKFDSLDALVAQIRDDVAAARRVLGA